MPNQAASRWLISVVVATITVVASPGVAWAHAELVSSDPGYGDQLPAAPQHVRLNFSGAMNLTGSRAVLRRSDGTRQALRQPSFGPTGRQVVQVGLPADLDAGTYGVDWYFLGTDGHLMAGEVAFTVGDPAPPTPPPTAAPSPQRPATTTPTAAARTLGPGIAGPALASEAAPPPRPAPRRSAGGFRLGVTTPQQVVRFVDYVSMAILVGGGVFLAVVWRDGARVRRVQRLLWAALAGSALATFLTFGLTAAGLRGLPAVDGLRPSVMAELVGTRLARVLVARAGFLALAVPLLGMLALGRERAARSRWWQALAMLSGGGMLASRAFLGHVSNEGLAARLGLFVHLVGVAAWLGGLIILVAVVVPRRDAEELRAVLPRFSRMAFGAVTAMVIAGAVTLIRVVPSLRELPSTGYGRLLLLKLTFVALLLAAAQQARIFTERRLVLRDAPGEPFRLRPLLTAVGVELTLAVLILASTSMLAGRPPPPGKANAVATPPPASLSQPPEPKGPIP